jgi:hypothetical protein
MIFESELKDLLMPSTTVKKKVLSTATSIEDSFSEFLNALRAELPASAVKNTETVIDMLRHHLNTCDEGGGDKTFCIHARPADIESHLDRFLRCCVMRELVLTFEQQEFVFFVTYSFCDWLYKNNLLPDNVFVAFQLLRDHHMDMWKRACTAAHMIASSLARHKSMIASDQVIDFGRHDIARIKGDQIWLDIWSLPILPEECEVGPIKLPKDVAASLEVGWMITCEIAKSNSGWRIVQIGNIYPALPFN